MSASWGAHAAPCAEKQAQTFALSLVPLAKEPDAGHENAMVQFAHTRGERKRSKDNMEGRSNDDDAVPLQQPVSSWSATFALPASAQGISDAPVQAMIDKYFAAFDSGDLPTVIELWRADAIEISVRGLMTEGTTRRALRR